MSAWFSIFVNERCVFDGRSTLFSAMTRAAREHAAGAGRVQVFRGKGLGRLVFDSRDVPAEEERS